jgi:hypothetical protein
MPKSPRPTWLIMNGNRRKEITYFETLSAELAMVFLIIFSFIFAINDSRCYLYKMIAQLGTYQRIKSNMPMLSQ